jgi:hypothetical protein
LGARLSCNHNASPELLVDTACVVSALVVVSLAGAKERQFDGGSTRFERTQWRQGNVEESYRSDGGGSIEGWKGAGDKSKYRRRAGLSIRCAVVQRLPEGRHSVVRLYTDDGCRVAGGGGRVQQRAASRSEAAERVPAMWAGVVGGRW